MYDKEFWETHRNLVCADEIPSRLVKLLQTIGFQGENIFQALRDFSMYAVKFANVTDIAVILISIIDPSHAVSEGFSPDNLIYAVAEDVQLDTIQELIEKLEEPPLPDTTSSPEPEPFGRNIVYLKILIVDSGGTWHQPLLVPAMIPRVDVQKLIPIIDSNIPLFAQNRSPIHKLYYSLANISRQSHPSDQDFQLLLILKCGLEILEKCYLDSLWDDKHSLTYRRIETLIKDTARKFWTHYEFDYVRQEGNPLLDGMDYFMAAKMLVGLIPELYKKEQ